MTAKRLFDLMLLTIRQPREGAETVLAFGVPRQAQWDLFFLVVVLSVILGHLTSIVMGLQSGAGSFAMGPVTLGLVQLALLVTLVFGVFYVGRAAGGTGSLGEAVLLITWLQTIMVALQLLQTIVWVVLPPLAGLVGIAGVLLFLWLLTHFVAVLHGFTSLGKVFFSILGGFFAFGLILSFILTFLGVEIAGTV